MGFYADCDFRMTLTETFAVPTAKPLACAVTTLGPGDGFGVRLLKDSFTKERMLARLPSALKATVATVPSAANQPSHDLRVNGWLFGFSTVSVR